MAVVVAEMNSVLYKYTISDNSGTVYFDGVKSGDYIFQLSCMGYNNYSKKITVSDTNNLTDLGNIKLNSTDLNIDEVFGIYAELQVVIESLRQTKQNLKWSE